MFWNLSMLEGSLIERLYLVDYVAIQNGWILYKSATKLLKLI